MITVQTVSNTELNQNKQHNPLTEQQKLYNRVEGHITVFQMILEKVLADGGIKNGSIK